MTGDFGHFSAIVDGCCIDAWGAGPFVIAAAGKTWRFEDSDQFGPQTLTKTDETARLPPERSPFWRAHRIWVRQGRRVADDGLTCVWDEPQPSKVRMIGKRTALMIECGDEDGATLIEGRDFPAAEGAAP